jgi:hypothetical protein
MTFEHVLYRAPLLGIGVSAANTVLDVADVCECIVRKICSNNSPFAFSTVSRKSKGDFWSARERYLPIVNSQRKLDRANFAMRGKENQIRQLVGNTRKQVVHKMGAPQEIVSGTPSS